MLVYPGFFETVPRLVLVRGGTAKFRSCFVGRYLSHRMNFPMSFEYRLRLDFLFTFPNPIKLLHLKSFPEPSNGSVPPVPGWFSPLPVRFGGGSVPTPCRFHPDTGSVPALPFRFLYRFGSISRFGFYITGSVPLRFVSCRCRFPVPGSFPRPPW